MSNRVWAEYGLGEVAYVGVYVSKESRVFNVNFMLQALFHALLLAI